MNADSQVSRIAAGCYTGRESVPRYFTLPQAESYLPEVERLVLQCIDAKGAYDRAEEEIAAFLRKISFTGGMVVSPGKIADPKRRKQESVETLQSTVMRFEEIGVLLKDVQTGLLDFPTLYRGREVYLCWRLGENGISFWHQVEDGFQGRRAIDAEFLKHHSARE
jgi:Uncharacterized conserved protein (DUF2203)